MVEDAMAELGRRMREMKANRPTLSRHNLACNSCFEIMRQEEFDAIFERER